MSTLFLMATPIGNLEDVTDRARRVLREVHVLACEDTRRTRILLEHCGIPKPGLVLPCHEHNEDRVCGRLLDCLDRGETVALCTNAGYPAVSDPGYLLLSRAIQAGHRIEVVPGPGAVEVALLMSGLPVSSYTFKGFPPRKPGRRRAFLEMDLALPHTLVFFESPFRVGAFLTDAFEVLGDRMAAVCIELTKKFERVHRGYLSDLIPAFEATPVKGEVTVVVAGNHPKFVRDASPAAAVKGQHTPTPRT